MRTEHVLHALPTFPVYSVGFLSDDKVVLGGGGGAGRSGVKNKLVSSIRAGIAKCSQILTCLAHVQIRTKGIHTYQRV